MSGKNGVFGYEIGVSDKKLEKWLKLKIQIFVKTKISAPTALIYHIIPRNSNIFEP